MSARDMLYGTLADSGSETNIADLSQIAGGLLPRSGENLAESLTAVTKSLDGLAAMAQAQSDAVGSNTNAVLQNTAAQSSGGAKNTLSTIGKFASGILGSGLGLLPAFSAISKLFGGGSEESQPALVTYSAPPSLHIDAVNPSGAARTDGWLGLGSGSTERRNTATSASTTLEPSPTELKAAASPQITIQVQAMDSRSFMDHSGDIARAVREAMLNMHALNDVVTDL
ncbi:MAG: hypothetical protein LC130_08895 [Bryobacterales bacterium]|nr:hypothetical protein [Bryobacterales bacterium]